MRKPALTLVFLSIAGAALVADSWPHWRGPSMDGISTEKGLPTTWSATENVAWKPPVAARGPHWRGPSMDGISTEKGLPTTWSATENVAWKLPLPAFSGSTPIIWDDTVFLNGATARATRPTQQGRGADRLGRHRVPERRDRARHRANRAVGRRSEQAGGGVETPAGGREPYR